MGLVGIAEMNIDYFEAMRRGFYGNNKDLPDGLDLGQVNDSKQSLLHAAVAFKDSTVASQLILKGIDVNLSDENGQTPLHYCAIYGDLAVAELILRSGGDMSKVDKYGNTALWTAVFNARGNYTFVEKLLEMGGHKYASTKNTHGISPLQFAERINDRSLLKLLEHYK
jgi:ankyrin repeat protein